MTPDQIESIAIHPAIGIARIGNSEDGFFYAPRGIAAQIGLIWDSLCESSLQHEQLGP